MIIIKTLLIIICSILLACALLTLTMMIFKPLRERLERKLASLKDQNEELEKEKARVQSKYNRLVNDMDVPELLTYQLKLISELVSLKPVPWYMYWNFIKHLELTAERRSLNYMIKEVSIAIKNKQENRIV